MATKKLLRENMINKSSKDYVPKSEAFRCSICFDWFTGEGNECWPVKKDNHLHECCDTCNDTIIIPARINQLLGVQA